MDPDLVRDVLSNKFGYFTKLKPNPVVKLFVTGLVSYNGEKWSKHRKIINPAFHQEKLKLMMPAFYTSCNELISRWDKLALEGSFELDIAPELQCLTENVISRTLFGSNYKVGRQIFELQTKQQELLFQSSQFAYIPGSSVTPLGLLPVFAVVSTPEFRVQIAIYEVNDRDKLVSESGLIEIRFQSRLYIILSAKQWSGLYTTGLEWVLLKLPCKANLNRPKYKFMKIFVTGLVGLNGGKWANHQSTLPSREAQDLTTEYKIST
ncbi:hypothetical protein Syun_027426 [Stephania yunnanensis]|uniref:Cytochrome P450 n=1 Tax=Stephania yunnanensis TaxID=152371 RepID=A0AAP0EFL2_9MAGN